MGIFRNVRLFFIDQLGFNKKESQGVIVLFLVVIAVFIASLIKPGHEDIHDESDQLLAWSEEIKASIVENIPAKKAEPFNFDPNKANLKELESLGFGESVSLRIVNYREAGGEFKKPEDLRKIYGMDGKTLDELLPYVDIEIAAKTSIIAENRQQEISESASAKTEAIIVKKQNLNTASADDLQRIRGIGPVLSVRAIKYRDLLGGFVSMTQLGEVYGINDSLVSAFEAEFVIEKEPLTPLVINTDSIRHLSRHPYLDFNLARAIVNFRKANGDYKSVEEIRQIKIMTDSLYQKVYPYLSIRP